MAETSVFPILRVAIEDILDSHQFLTMNVKHHTVGRSGLRLRAYPVQTICAELHLVREHDLSGHSDIPSAANRITCQGWGIRYFIAQSTKGCQYRTIHNTLAQNTPDRRLALLQTQFETRFWATITLTWIDYSGTGLRRRARLL